MKREKLIESVNRAAVAAGYAFHTGEVQGINGAVRVYPAAWLVPPVVRKVTGRREGEVVYRVMLHLMLLPGAAEVSALWAALERDALSVAAKLALDGAVCAVAGVSCTPSHQSLTVHGEISVALACDVTMWYYN